MTRMESSIKKLDDYTKWSSFWELNWTVENFPFYRKLGTSIISENRLFPFQAKFPLFSEAILTICPSLNDRNREWTIHWFSIHNFESKDITGPKSLLYFIMIVNWNCTLKTSKKSDKKYLKKHFHCTILLNSSNHTKLNILIKRLLAFLNYWESLNAEFWRHGLRNKGLIPLQRNSKR